ncbi:ATP-binding protein [Nesterenkonia sp. K-15-9-6]|uniref:ATP-binding protein n=1 Tax=Nesterenkonia sp. K-15-9-6 TaxID=3093918 RepID=UPI0040448702
MTEPHAYEIAAHMAPFGKRPLSTVLLERECLRHGLTTLRSGALTFTAADPAGQRMAFSRTGSVLNSNPAAPVARNKQSTRLLLEQAGVPAPRGRRFSRTGLQAALAFAEQIGWPVVCKPVEGAEGRGVVTGIRDAEELRWAFRAAVDAARGAREVLVEEHIEAEAYRVIVLEGVAVSALISRRGAVVGDGEHTVEELIDARQRLREMNPHLIGRPIPRGEPLERLLARQGAALDTVLEPGVRVEYSYGSNTHQGGEHEQVLQDMHPSLIDAACRAVAQIPGLGSAGVDFLIEDITRPVDQQRAAICEINSVPAIDSHEYPVYGPALPVAAQMVSRAAAAAGLRLSTPESDEAEKTEKAETTEKADILSVEMTITGRLPRREHAEWFTDQARAMGLRGTYRRLDERTARAVVAGPAEHVGVFLSLAYEGSARSTVRTIESRPCPTPAESGFAVLPDGAPSVSTAEPLPGEAARGALRGHEEDTWLVHTALLEAGLSTRALPGGSLAASPRGTRPGPDVPSVPFTHMRSVGATFGGGSMTRDRAVLWPVLEARGVPTPQWRRFRVGAVELMTEFAETLGWPVAIGARGSADDAVAEDAAALAAAARERAEEGRRSVIVSSCRPGRRVDLLTTESAVLAAVEPGPDGGTVIPVERLSPGLRGMALRAFAEVPGVSLAQVRLAVSDPEAPLGAQQTVVVEDIAPPRPLSTFSADGYRDALSLARTLVGQELDRAGLVDRDAGTEAGPIEQTRQLVALGVPAPEEAAQRLEDRAAVVGCRCDAAQVDREEATLRAEVSGRPAELALLACLLLSSRSGPRADAVLLG